MPEKKLNPAELENALNQFTGTENYYKHWLGLKYTDGVKFLADNAGAHWLLDAIASWQGSARKDSALCDYQFWTLAVKPDKTAVLTCDRDQGDTAFKQEFDFADFPLPEIKIWVENGVMLLPGEH